METLLGSKSPNDRNSSATVEAARNEQLARTSHRSTTVELEEEHDASEKPGTGAFGVQGADESITKDVWKLTDESTYLATQKAEAEERAARKAAELAEIASGTDADSLHAGEADAVIPSTTKRVARTAYRFVDTSSVASAPKSKK
jgi:hypothetical protein